MNDKVRAVRNGLLTLASLAVFHSALVPPVAGGACRYAAWLDRALPFTRTYEGAGVSLPALLAEWGVIAGVTGALVGALLTVDALLALRRRSPPGLGEPPLERVLRGPRP